MAGNRLVMKDAEKARDAITASQKKEIKKLYNDWADEIGDRVKFYKNKTTASSVVSERQMRELKRMIKNSSKEISNEINNNIQKNLYMTADAVVKSNAKWLNDIGFKNKTAIDVAFNHVPDDIVRNLIAGNVYESGWSLSKRIWSDNQKTMKDIYSIVAKGVAENRPIYDIAKNLEDYVRPNAKKSWNLIAKDGVKIYKKAVDYNAQRLARTLVQHTYQQSFVAVTKNNPFVIDYIWHSNGSRVCKLCMDRDGQHFSKDNLPLDHPNGMCTMIPNISDNMDQQLIDWFNNPNGTYPEIDNFARNFGYSPE